MEDFGRTIGSGMHPAVKKAFDEAMAKNQNGSKNSGDFISNMSNNIKNENSYDKVENIQEPPKNNNSIDYPREGSVVLVFDNKNKEFIKDDEEYVIESPIQITDIEDYENEEEMKEIILRFNDKINNYHGGQGQHVMFVGKRVKNIITQVKFEF
jgi:hypothetical protein